MAASGAIFQQAVRGFMGLPLISAA